MLLFFSDIAEKMEQGQGASEKFFQKWNEEVETFVPPHQLLVFDVSQGWGPLCKFLELPVPDLPFPKENDITAFTKVYENLYHSIKMISIGFVGLITATVVPLAIYYFA